ncbi:MAG: SMP-30/gluconolactonase/LRE family protein [Thermomicrobiales bacterium]
MSQVSGVWDVTIGLESDPLRDLAEFRTWANGLDHPEGVAEGPDGTIYAGGELGQVYRIAPDGTAQQIGMVDGFALGLALDADSNVYICETSTHSVKKVTPEGVVSNYTSGVPGRAFVNPNYPVFDAEGNLYITDSGHWGGKDGCILVVRPDRTTELFSEGVPAFPNGLALSPDGQWLYVVASELPGIVRVAIEPDGSAGTVETVVELPKNVPDGIAFDAEGTLYIACYAPSVVYRFGTDGVLDVLGYDWQNTQLAAPTNIAFTGPQRTTMVIGSLSRWHLTTIEMEIPGLPMRFPKLG